MKEMSRIQKRAVRALALLDSEISVVRGYLFGSYVDGEADEYSDVDIAAFIDAGEKLILRRKVQLMSLVQQNVGDDIEVHLFPASALEGADTATFTSFIVRKGKPIAYKH